MTTPARPLHDGDGLVHLGLLYDDADDLVSRCLPEIRSVLDDGGDVHVTVDRRGVRGFREALGADADRVSFPSPSAAYGDSTPELLRRMRSWVRPGRRTLIVGQYVTHSPPGWDCAFAEDAVNLVLADLPLTVVCACERSGPAANLALVARAHARLVGAGDGERVSNPDHREPEGTSPAPMAPWGDPVMEMTVRGGEDLAEVRRQVTTVARQVGLTGGSLSSVVLSVHEAVLLAGRTVAGAAPHLPGGEQEVRVRTAGGAIVTEVLATEPVDDTEATDEPDLRRACLPSFCDRLAVHDGPYGRLVRVLSSV